MEIGRQIGLGLDPQPLDPVFENVDLVVKRHLPLPEQRHMRGDPFEIGGDVGREEDGAGPVGGGLEHRLEKPAPGHRIEARHRLIEDQQLGAMTEREHEGELLFLPHREWADELAQRQIPAPQKLVSPGPIPAGIKARHVGHGLADGEPGIERRFLGHIADPGLLPIGQLPGIGAEDGRGALVGLEQAEQAFDERALPRAVEAEEADHLPPRHPQIDRIEDRPRIEAFDEARHVDRVNRHTVPVHVAFSSRDVFITAFSCAGVSPSCSPRTTA